MLVSAQWVSGFTCWRFQIPSVCVHLSSRPPGPEAAEGPCRIHRTAGRRSLGGIGGSEGAPESPSGLKTTAKITLPATI